MTSKLRPATKKELKVVEKLIAKRWGPLVAKMVIAQHELSRRRRPYANSFTILKEVEK